MSGLAVRQQPHFKWWDDGLRGAPNSMIRSSFVALERGSAYMQDVQFSISDGRLGLYSGPQIDAHDFDLWLEIVNAARREDGDSKYIISGCVELSIRDLLQGTGRDVDGPGCKRVLLSLKRLQGVVIQVEQHNGTILQSQLLLQILRNSNGENTKLKIQLDRRLVEFFADGITRLDVQQRREMLKRKAALAVWLHAFYSSHRPSKYIYSVQRIHELCGSSNSNLRSFKQKLKQALSLLSALTGWECSIQDEKIHIKKG